MTDTGFDIQIDGDEEKRHFKNIHNYLKGLNDLNPKIDKNK